MWSARDVCMFSGEEAMPAPSDFPELEAFRHEPSSGFEASLP